MIRALLILLAVLPGMAFAAEPLTKKQVENFLAVAEAMKALDEKYEDTDIDFGIEEGNPQAFLNQMFTDQGDLRMMQVLMDKVQTEPALLADVDRAVKQNGFRSRDAFAEIGDRILLTSIRLHLSESDLRGISEAANIPAEQLAILPEPMRPMIEKMSKFATAIQSVPREDVALLEDYRADFERLGEE